MQNTRITSSPRLAASFVTAGDVVAFPTETVYGLGADALNPRAIKGIYAAKGRPQDNPLIVHIACIEDVAIVARRLPVMARELMDRFFPGPLTVIIPRHPDLPKIVTAGLDTVAVRMPRHPVAQTFLTACATPVAAPSANVSGRPSPTTWRAVEKELGGRIACILKGPAAEVGLESTVVDCTGRKPVILREGAITREQLSEVRPDVRSADRKIQAVTRSPGTKHRHYAPHARVCLVAEPHDVDPETAPESGYIGLDKNGFREKPRRVLACRDIAHYAQNLFRFFRQCENLGLKTVYCQNVPETGLGRALMDRLRRAARG